MIRLPSDALVDGAPVRCPRPPYDVLAVRVDGRVYAIEDACPHSGQSLCEGRMEGHVVVCAGHGWRLDVRTGEVLTEVGCGESNPVFRVREAGGVVIIE